jgi:hypothetical protein
MSSKPRASPWHELSLSKSEISACSVHEKRASCLRTQTLSTRTETNLGINLESVDRSLQRQPDAMVCGVGKE